ncbi:MAG TPA: response regulator transcription factor, partial [Candidatus Dormibacteraeota bacterium]|nr:response regulator transcription factor [Candidatus Dormibacteraeota bacterium]
MKIPRYLCRRFNPAAQALSNNSELAPALRSSGPENNERSESGVGLLSDTAPTHYSPNAVLIVMPDAEIRNLLAFGLKQQRFAVIEAASGDEANELALQWRPCAILLDMELSHGNGLAVLTQLREWSRIPILALAGRQGGPGAIEALDHGASDFILRPFNIEEVSARLRAARRYAPPPAPEVFQSGSLQVDLTSRTVKVAQKTVRLSGTEYSLLQL